MKKLVYIILIIESSLLYGQVGIGTMSPQKAVSISGTSTGVTIPATSIELRRPTIRVEGLNNTNQSISDKIRPISVTDQGDLVLAPALVKPLIMIDSFNSTNSETDYLPSSITTNQTTTALATDLVLRTFSFNITSPSLVKIGAVTSFQFSRADNGNPVTDGSNRLWGTRFRFSLAPAGISTAATSYFGESLKGYYNRVSNASATGIHYANSEDVIFLPSGSYAVEVISSVTTATGQTPLRIINGSGDDTFSVIAYPVE
ncbi:hypothetical protein LNP04_14045 [Chryseobacterium sp. C-71]|uniref:hypothetical protein n=1 Tax=Chryseobacterium sp. C-71 TaxID=2893882 RepID=UPI001E60AF7A|nr:hypothetical protein [Chryseobacterium sp. C-71]UFH31089.1 hypothetical protein LNP04_14045 [Chryseobacterium sp. C-71]